MKKSILVVVASAFITGAILTSCNSSEKKLENAQENVTEANIALDKANKEYIADIENSRKQAAEKFAANEQNIADFKARIDLQKKEARAEYKEKIAKLEQQNSDMKKRLADYKEEGKDKWEIFKTEFNHDMDELGIAIKDLATKNVK